MKRSWLGRYSWEMIQQTNELLCNHSNVEFETMGERTLLARDHWEQNHLQEISLMEATKLCQQCHRFAPFKNFNGNTFVTIIRNAISTLPLEEADAAIVRSCLGHMVAGVASQEEEAQLERIEREVEARQQAALLKENPLTEKNKFSFIPGLQLFKRK